MEKLTAIMQNLFKASKVKPSKLPYYCVTTTDGKFNNPETTDYYFEHIDLLIARGRAIKLCHLKEYMSRLTVTDPKSINKDTDFSQVNVFSIEMYLVTGDSDNLHLIGESGKYTLEEMEIEAKYYCDNNLISKSDCIVISKADLGLDEIDDDADIESSKRKYTVLPNVLELLKDYIS